VSQSLRIKAFDILRHGPDGPLGTLGGSTHEALADDNIRIHVEFNQPAHCFVIAFHPNGEQEYYPRSDVNVPPAALATVELPWNKDRGFGLTDGVGLQAFVVVASRQQLPAYSEWLDQMGKPHWQTGVANVANGVWRFDGQDFLRLDGLRGDERTLAGPPKPFVEVCRFFQGRGDFEVVQAISFQVKPRPN
jgi:hypothetical protein